MNTYNQGQYQPQYQSQYQPYPQYQTQNQPQYQSQYQSVYDSHQMRMGQKVQPVPNTMEQVYYTTQPQMREQNYAGKQQEIRRHNMNIEKSRTKQYFQNRTDIVPLKTIVNGKQQQVKYDEDEYGEYSFPDPYIKYKIIPAQQYKMALDVTSIDKPDDDLVKGNMIIWDYHGGPNQHFYFQKTPNPGYYYIINASTGFVLDVPQSNRSDGVHVHMTPRFNTESQVWKLQPAGKDLYMLRSFCGKVLDVKGTFMRNGNHVIQYRQNNGKNQKWMIWPS